MKPNAVDEILLKPASWQLDDYLKAKRLLLAEVLKALPVKREYGPFDRADIIEQIKTEHRIIDQASQALTNLIMGEDK